MILSTSQKSLDQSCKLSFKILQHKIKKQFEIWHFIHTSKCNYCIFSENTFYRLLDGEYKLTLEAKCRHVSGFECSNGPRATPKTQVADRNVGTGSRRVSSWLQICNNPFLKILTLCLMNKLLWQPFHRCRATKQQSPACQLIFPQPPRPQGDKRFHKPIGSRHQICWHSRVGAEKKNLIF